MEERRKRRPRTPNNLAEFLRMERERADLTQEALAELSGVSRDNIAAIENGKSKVPDPSIVKLLADALLLTVDDFVDAMGFKLAGTAEAVRLAQERMRNDIRRTIDQR